jgi:hypothetical protein
MLTKMRGRYQCKEIRGESCPDADDAALNTDSSEGAGRACGAARAAGIF